MTRSICAVTAALLAIAVTFAAAPTPAEAGRFVTGQGDISNKPVTSVRLPPRVNPDLTKERVCRDRYGRRVTCA
ncbi:hypothetical protein ACQR1Y_25970 [Bradyrhizobium sp. HKCCYLRH3099]|uniref:hypothetical protein n=1 Tax=unclassified Bradyrhizobium TaxID=2631580 RepID=UPI003EBD09BF